jgi:hypothetical protein
LDVFVVGVSVGNFFGDLFRKLFACLIIPMELSPIDWFGFAFFCRDFASVEIFLKSELHHDCGMIGLYAVGSSFGN